jgi:spermidine/putrescine transport system ATP-binding protein
MSSIRAENVVKKFGDSVAVDDVSFAVEDGELWCLLGPSGCGKSTTLRMLGGLEHPTSGDIYIDDERVTETRAYNRSTSVVFQNWALFPQKTVLENVTFGPKMQGAGKQERIELAEKYLELMQMEPYKDKPSTDLSGGQQQRVALARSLAMDPSVLLLDEPLSNLDKRLKEEMQIELKRLHDQLGKTMIYVTHDQNEAFTLADRISIMNQGNLIQVGDPRDVYADPKNRFIEEFLGDTNMMSLPIKSIDGNDVLLEFGGGQRILVTVDSVEELDESEALTVSFRPEFLDLELHREPDPKPINTDGSGRDNLTSLVGTVTDTLYRGSSVRHYIDVGGEDLFIEHDLNQSDRVERGDSVAVTWDPSELLCFEEHGTRVV